MQERHSLKRNGTIESLNGIMEWTTDSEWVFGNNLMEYLPSHNFLLSMENVWQRHCDVRQRETDGVLCKMCLYPHVNVINVITACCICHYTNRIALPLCSDFFFTFMFVSKMVIELKVIATYYTKIHYYTSVNDNQISLEKRQKKLHWNELETLWSPHSGVVACELQSKQSLK